MSRVAIVAPALAASSPPETALPGGDLSEIGLLTKENFGTLVNMTDDLIDNWSKRQVFRTETEMRFSVLNDLHFPTKAAKYWQAIREQSNMLDNLAVISFQYRRNEVALKRLNKKLTEADSAFEIEEIEIDIDECEYRRASLRQNANDRVRELFLWSQIMRELDDGSFSIEDIDAHQLESYIAMLEQQKANLVNARANPAEISNIIGPLNTALRIQSERKRKQ
jgi:hypothetical protein